MSNFDLDFENVLKNLKENIKDEDDLDIAKVEVFRLYNMFLDSLTEQEQTLNKKLLAIAESQLHVEEEIRNISKSLKNIEKDIYMDDEVEDEDCDVEIKCPYCNKTFTAKMSELTETEEIKCPECKNMIELDWGDGCEDDDCGCCSHGCHHHNEDEEDDM